MPRSVKINNQTVTALSQVTPARTVYYTNTGPNALPAIVLPTTDPVQVTISYTLEPKLKTVVSTPFLGRVKYAALGAGASIKRVGSFNIGPLIKGEHVFKAGEFEVYNGDPSSIDSAGPRSEFQLSQDLERYDLRLVDTATESVPTMGCGEVIIYKVGSILWIRIFDITGDLVTDRPASELLTSTMLAELNSQLTPWPLSSLTGLEKERVLQRATAIAGQAPGTITFVMQAAGPPSYFWKPSQLNNINPFWTYKANGPITNWLEIISIPPSSASYPGEFGSGSDATIDESPFPTLYDALQIASLRVAPGRRLDIVRWIENKIPGLTVWGGIVENEGVININSFSDDFDTGFVRLNNTEAMLTGTGTFQITGGKLLGPENGGPVTFTNHNYILGNGEAMDLYLNHSDSTIKNMGTILSQGNRGQFLITSAHHYINNGSIYSSGGSGISLKGDRLESRAGSDLSAFGGGSSTILTFAEVELSGRAVSSSGGYLRIATRNTPRTVWNAGLSFNEDVGEIVAFAADATIDMQSVDLIGGRVRVDRTGQLKANNSTFAGSQMMIGKFDPAGIETQSGFLSIYGDENTFTKVNLNNYGTIQIYGKAEFIDTEAFANNGAIVVPVGGQLTIREVTPAVSDPNVSDVARSFPGIANATDEMLVGGTWDVGGTLVIEGADFLRTGANAARSDTSFGSIDEGEHGSNQSHDPDLTVQDDLSLVLSLGALANVTLRGPAWSFAAFNSLQENAGWLHLTEGADFPSGGSTQRTAGDFINTGGIVVGSASALKAGGAFIQTGVDADTEIQAQGEISSGTNHFLISGGSVKVYNSGIFMNRVGNTFQAGTTIEVISPLVDTNEVDFLGNPVFVQEIVSVDLGSGVAITHIAEGVDLSLYGKTVRFPALSQNLQSNAGRLTIGGEGLDNAGVYRFAGFAGQVFTNTGELNIVGSSSDLEAANFTQSGSNAVTRVGAGAEMSIFGALNINGGELVVEIASRPRENDYGQIRASQISLNNRLVIDFTDKIAETIPDIGDTWEIVPRVISAAITGVSTETVTWRLNGAPLPDGWLPAGSHLAIRQFVTSFGLRGLGVQVVPDEGFLTYDSWATTSGLNRATPLSDPMRDANDDGIINAMEYLYGSNDGDGTFPGQQKQGLVQIDGYTFFEISYVRPSNVDAVYMPYYSRDLIKWYISSMDIVEISDTGLGQGLEWVTLRTTYPVPEGSLFFRVRGFLNAENFDIGLLPNDPIPYGSTMRNFGQTLQNSLGHNVIYTIEPGKVLYFSVNGDSRNSSIYGGTAPNGERNRVYQDRGSLATAVVHAGLLGHGQSGIIKVTFTEPQQTPFIGSTQNQGTGNNQVTSESTPADSAPYSIMIELAERF